MYVVILIAGSMGILSFSISPNTARLIVEHWDKMLNALKFWKK